MKQKILIIGNPEPIGANIAKEFFLRKESKAKELLQCSVCWGDGKIEIDDYGNEIDCKHCNGTGIIERD